MQYHIPLSRVGCFYYPPLPELIKPIIPTYTSAVLLTHESRHMCITIHEVAELWVGYSCSNIPEAKKSFLTMWKIQGGDYNVCDRTINDKFFIFISLNGRYCSQPGLASVELVLN